MATIKSNQDLGDYIASIIDEHNVLDGIIKYKADALQIKLDKNIEIRTQIDSNFNLHIDVSNNENYAIAKHIIGLFISEHHDDKIIHEKFMTYDRLIVENDQIKEVMKHLIFNIITHRKNYYGLCCICYKELPSNMGIIRCCKLCHIDSYEVIYDNLITDTFKKDVNVFRLLLLTSLSGLKTIKQYNMIPDYCRSGTYEEKMFSGVSHVPAMYVDVISKCSSDQELKEKITSNEYKFLRYMIKSNQMDISYFDNSKSMIKTENIWDTNENIIFSVHHDAETENKFNFVQDVVYMFHGSNTSNWSSIMKNGLKNYSGTTNMKNGQAHGSGIYLSPFLSFSLSYSSKEYNNDVLVGVVQVLNSESYCKTKEIYVATDESNMLLKYLVLVRRISDCTSTNITSIQNYLTKVLPTEIKSSTSSVIGIILKRLTKEQSELEECIKKINKTLVTQNKIVTLTIDNEINVLSKWIINVSSNKGDELMSIIIRFFSTFPTKPPSIIIESKEKISSHIPFVSKIDDNNYRYIDISTTREKWSSTVKIYKVLSNMLNNLLIEKY